MLDTILILLTLGAATYAAIEARAANRSARYARKDIMGTLADLETEIKTDLTEAVTEIETKVVSLGQAAAAGQDTQPLIDEIKGITSGIRASLNPATVAPAPPPAL